MPDLSAVFAELRAVMKPFADQLDTKIDSDTKLYVDTRHEEKSGKATFFGAVEVKKNFVSYHLMPVYVEPGLLDQISPELRKKMQGKSCFNFSKVDEPLFAQLAALTKASFADYGRKGFVSKSSAG